MQKIISLPSILLPLAFANQHKEWYLPSDDKVVKSFLFGIGDSVEWGDKDGAGTITPQLIDIPSLHSGEYIIDIAAGGLHSAVVTNEGRIFTAGSSDDSGALGRDGGLGFMPIPILSQSQSKKFAKVVASQVYTLALDTLGNAWSTGGNAYGQLCLGDTINRDRFEQVTIPTSDSKIVDVALGERHTLLLLENGKVYGCGWNQYGQLGIGIKGENLLAPVEIIIDHDDAENGHHTNDVGTVDHENIIAIAAGRGTSYFHSSSGHVFSAGTNYNGQLCLGHRDDRPLPTRIVFQDDDSSVVDTIAAGISSLYLHLTNGMVMVCGDNTQGQLGLDSDRVDSLDVPTLIANNGNIKIFSDQASYEAYVVEDDLRVFTVRGFGDSSGTRDWSMSGLVACNDEKDLLKQNVAAISAGNDHTLYLVMVEISSECDDDDKEEDADTSFPLVTRDPTASSTKYWSTSAPPTDSLVGVESTAPNTPAPSPFLANGTSLAPVESSIQKPDNGARGYTIGSFGTFLLGVAISFLW